MIDPPEIVDTTAQLMAFIHLTVASEEIRRVIDPGLEEVLGVLVDQGVEPFGPWFTRHLKIDPDIFHFEVCVPVETPVKPTGRVQAGDWPAMRVARAVYRGPYSGLSKAWSELNDWIAASGHTPAQDLWERYVSSPPRERRTELNRALIV